MDGIFYLSKPALVKFKVQGSEFKVTAEPLNYLNSELIKASQPISYDERG
ncbi:MAG: hypothetical protein AAB275_00880 [Deltaproteobacteria bacterium]